ncbi:hypothetical protein [Caproicibacterium amylolyticum]|uniref:Uncharacterized protein n=1 Tax=Caproicibacterium amylolyticum TaxID=2766537 RepID=A0A7G9WFC1_9FIRM|nr:hypothetical protein [Caproicibacterium amylolyticum]QNO17383.1 hypothetical protein H6X83_10585 [Caproicibacterium amylolyticum]
MENPNKGFSSTGGAGACLFVLAPWNASMVLVFTYVCFPEFTVACWLSLWGILLYALSTFLYQQKGTKDRQGLLPLTCEREVRRIGFTGRARRKHRNRRKTSAFCLRAQKTILNWLFCR